MSLVVWWFCWFKGRHDKLIGIAWNSHNLLWNWWPVYIYVIDMYVTMYVCRYVCTYVINNYIPVQCTIFRKDGIYY